MLSVFPLLLACVGVPLTATSGATPAWACPSPTPRLAGPAGPVKDWRIQARPTIPPISPIEYDYQPIYYEWWEQEYPAQGPIFPSPTPYVVVGTTFSQGQRVRLAPLFLTLTVERDPAVALENERLFWLVLEWLNPTERDVPVDYVAQLVVRTLVAADGSLRTSQGWRLRPSLLSDRDLPLPEAIPPGTSVVRLPILLPAEHVGTVEFTVIRGDTERPPSNDDLRATHDDHEVTVAFVAAAPAGPPCDLPGAITTWHAEADQVNGVAEVPLQAPPGSERVVEIALSQIGRRYVWGAKGPGSFDCSGLMQWAYAQIGISIPPSTGTQWPALRPVGRGQLAPGDLVFFTPRNGNRITHVGMLVGDVTGDGRWDAVHAASPELGVVLLPDIFHSRYYGNPATCQLCITGYRTVR